MWVKGTIVLHRKQEKFWPRNFPWTWSFISSSTKNSQTSSENTTLYNPGTSIVEGGLATFGKYVIFFWEEIEPNVPLMNAVEHQKYQRKTLKVCFLYLQKLSVRHERRPFNNWLTKKKKTEIKRKKIFLRLLGLLKKVGRQICILKKEDRKWIPSHRAAKFITQIYKRLW